MANERSGGIGLCGMLFLVFLVLKLCGVIAWSWWWVAAPLWIPAMFIFGFVATVGISAVTGHRR